MNNDGAMRDNPLVNDNIVLIGMTGAGKSVVGRALAGRLGAQFVDADDAVRKRAGKSIPEIFAQDGEARFRELESIALADILSGENLVVASGGGAVLRADNRAVLRRRATVVFLDASPELLRARLDGKARAARPLLQNGADVAALRRARLPLYRRLADFSLPAVAGESPGAAAERLLRMLRESPAVARAPLADGRDYPVVVGRGLLNDVTSWLGDSPVLTVVTSRRVFARFGGQVAEAAGKPPLGAFVVVPDGEEHKTLEIVELILDRFAEIKMGRDATVLALGGGMVGDVAGFAAAVYMRGTRLLQAPTTLLAMADAAIGGKTGVNHPAGKNLIGAFHQPAAVLCDLDTLATLPPAELRAGLAEVVKYGMLGDAAFFAWLEKNAEAIAAFEAAALRRIVLHSARAKAAIVAEDERESDARALLNLGHTFAHAIEAAAGYGEWRHGEAVAAGLVAAAELSARTLEFPRAEVDRVRNLLQRLGLPTALPGGLADELREAMRMDKKNRDGKERFVLMRRLGDATAGQAVDEDDLRAALAATAEKT